LSTGDHPVPRTLAQTCPFCGGISRVAGPSQVRQTHTVHMRVDRRLEAIGGDKGDLPASSFPRLRGRTMGAPRGRLWDTAGRSGRRGRTVRRGRRSARRSSTRTVPESGTHLVAQYGDGDAARTLERGSDRDGASAQPVLKVLGLEDDASLGRASRCLQVAELFRESLGWKHVEREVWKGDGTDLRWAPWGGERRYSGMQASGPERWTWCSTRRRLESNDDVRARHPLWITMAAALRRSAGKARAVLEAVPALKAARPYSHLPPPRASFAPVAGPSRLPYSPGAFRSAVSCD
jgi:hypothetical protein